jgi:hypothetical protein
VFDEDCGREIASRLVCPIKSNDKRSRHEGSLMMKQLDTERTESGGLYTRRQGIVHELC